MALRVLTERRTTVFWLVVDGQGGGIGRTLAERLVKAFPEAEVGVVGTNSTATYQMMKAGPAFGATGENAVVFNAARADVIIGPAGIVMANAMHGEISPAMAAAITSGKARIILIPMNRCRAYITGTAGIKLADCIADMVEAIRRDIVG